MFSYAFGKLSITLFLFSWPQSFRNVAFSSRKRVAKRRKGAAKWRKPAAKLLHC